MKISRPSPALVVAVVALVVACAGTATAASVLIKNSSQIATGAVNSSDIRNGTIQGVDVKNKTINGAKIADGAVTGAKVKANTIDASKLAPAVRNTLQGQGLTGTEAVRKAGPENVAAGGATITRITQLEAGTYFVSAKTTITGVAGDLGLGELLRPNKTASAECTLEIGGDVDKARTVVASPGAETPQTVNLQMTRTIASPTDAILTCSVTNVPWRASDSSVVALKLQGSTRTDNNG